MLRPTRKFPKISKRPRKKHILSRIPYKTNLVQEISAPLENSKKNQKCTKNKKNPESLKKPTWSGKFPTHTKKFWEKIRPERADIRAGAEAPVGGTKMRDTPHTKRINRNIIHVHQHPGRVGRGRTVHFLTSGHPSLMKFNIFSPHALPGIW